MFQTPATPNQGRTGAAWPRSADDTTTTNSWNALWAMMVGFFMILVDATIVAVANPSIMASLGADYDAVIWVTSAYLLAYAVPLLPAGRLGDRFGPKNLYLIGLTVFTAASLWCGLAGTIDVLIAARVVQGIGAALLTPQTLSTITRIFPAERRGVAMSVWGATAGVATLVGPLAGGVLVDRLGWQWIFFVNVPIGIVGLALAVWLIPVLPIETHRFDLLGVLLSGVGMFLIVFALQEGQSHDWAPWIWGTVAVGLAFMAGFVYWQSVNKHEPLIPLQIFRDRDFSLSNLGVATIGFVVTANVLPAMFYAQAVCGLSPTRSALLTAPMAIVTGVLAPFVGKIVDRSHPRPVVGFGFSVLAIALTWLSVEMTPTTPIWRLVLPFTAMGIGMAFIWSPLAATATRNLPPELAGAGSGVYNATRQVGSVLGSASMAAFMTARISAEMPAGPAAASRGEGAVTELPGVLHEPFAAAMSQSTLLPAFIALFGVVAALFLLGFGDRPAARLADDDPTAPVTRPTGHQDSREDHDDFVDDDECLEYTVTWDEPEPDESDTEPMSAGAGQLLHAPGPALGHPGPALGQESWRAILDELLADLPPKPSVEPIGFAHNGFHVDDAQRFQPLPPPAEPQPDDVPARHHRSDDEPRGWFAPMAGITASTRTTLGPTAGTRDPADVRR
jgi:EmrB/QacA subfamily drug resistance transporter